MAVHHQHTTGWSLWIGTGLIVLGVIVSLAASSEYYRFISLTKRGLSYVPRTALLNDCGRLHSRLLGIVMAVVSDPVERVIIEAKGTDPTSELFACSPSGLLCRLDSLISKRLRVIPQTVTRSRNKAGDVLVVSVNLGSKFSFTPLTLPLLIAFP